MRTLTITTVLILTMASMALAAPRTTVYHYDELNRLTQLWYEKSEIFTDAERYWWDELGNVTNHFIYQLEYYATDSVTPPVSVQVRDSEQEEPQTSTGWVTK